MSVIRCYCCEFLIDTDYEEVYGVYNDRYFLCVECFDMWFDTEYWTTRE